MSKHLKWLSSQIHKSRCILPDSTSFVKMLSVSSCLQQHLSHKAVILGSFQSRGEETLEIRAWDLHVVYGWYSTARIAQHPRLWHDNTSSQDKAQSQVSLCFLRAAFPPSPPSGGGVMGLALGGQGAERRMPADVLLLDRKPSPSVSPR